MNKEFPSTITVDDTTLSLVVIRKTVKNINARLRDATLHVSVPLHTSHTTINAILPSLARRLIRRQRARQINSDDDALALAQRVAQRFPTPIEVTATSFSTAQRARWGSYSTRTHAIRLHAALRHMPPWVLEAVVAHELAHVVHPNHSPAFWSLLRTVCPNTERAEAFLAGVNWLARTWDDLPPVERAQLRQVADDDEGDS